MKPTNKVGARWIAFQFANTRENATVGRGPYLPTVGAIVRFKYLNAAAARGNGARGRASATPSAPLRADYLV